MLVVLNVPMIGVWVKLLTIPYKYLFPSAISAFFIAMSLLLIVLQVIIWIRSRAEESALVFKTRRGLKPLEAEPVRVEAS